jgi:hypothetical protein
VAVMLIAASGVTVAIGECGAQAELAFMARVALSRRSMPQRRQQWGREGGTGSDVTPQQLGANVPLCMCRL